MLLSKLLVQVIICIHCLFRDMLKADQLLSHLKALEMMVHACSNVYIFSRFKDVKCKDHRQLLDAVKASINTRFALLSYIHNPGFRLNPVHDLLN